LARKLKPLKLDLKKWNEEVFGIVEKQKKVCLDELGDLDVIAEDRPLSDEEKARKVEITSMFNRTLLRKFLWRYATKREALWRSMVKAKCGSMWVRWCSEVFGSHGVGVWKNMRRGCGVSRLVRFEVGNESKIRFWQDVWCGDQPLKASLPTLLNIARFKKASMADFILSLNDIVQWNIIFIRPVHDGEVEMVTSFLNLLYYFRKSRAGEDRIFWIPSKRQTFEVRSFYHALSPLRFFFFDR
jgi:hypothetical protein